jgi:peptidylprolyl isomerase
MSRAGLILGFLLAALGIFFAVSVATPSSAMAQEGKPHLLLELKNGTVDIELLPEVAPKHVERVETLVKQGFYNGVVFHRVIDGFMAQTGDPTGTGMGGSDLPDLPAEFSNEPFVRGVIGAARSSDPNSANSQFFITYADASHLNGQYTVWGKVVSGMEFVDALKKGDQAQNGMVADPDKIISAKIEVR